MDNFYSYPAGASSSTRGIIAGGNVPGTTYNNIIQYVTISLQFKHLLITVEQLGILHQQLLLMVVTIEFLLTLLQTLVLIQTTTQTELIS